MNSGFTAHSCKRNQKRPLSLWVGGASCCSLFAHTVFLSMAANYVTEMLDYAIISRNTDILVQGERSWKGRVSDASAFFMWIQEPTIPKWCRHTSIGSHSDPGMFGSSPTLKGTKTRIPTIMAARRPAQGSICTRSARIREGIERLLGFLVRISCFSQVRRAALSEGPGSS
jgi:hypothetical protein